MRVIHQTELLAFEQHLRKQEKAAATVEKYMHDVQAFAEFLKDDPFEKEKVLAYKSRLLEEGYKARSVNAKLAAINSLLDFLGWTECRVKIMKIQRDIFCREAEELTRTEFERLCAAAQRTGNERLELILQTLGGTGIRISELPYITVEAVRRGTAVVTLKGKTRTVFFVRELRRRLLDYIRRRGLHHGAVFVTRTGRPVSRTNVWREMKKLCFMAKVSEKKVFPHNLRHLFARVFYAVKQDIAKLADVLGHSSIETTRIYIVSDGREHRQIMEQMCLIE